MSALTRPTVAAHLHSVLLRRFVSWQTDAQDCGVCTAGRLRWTVLRSTMAGPTWLRPLVGAGLR